MLHFLRNRYFIMAVIVLCIFIAMGISTKGGKEFSSFGSKNIVSTVVSPFQKVLSMSARKVEDTVSFFVEMRRLKAENEELALKVDMLESENRRVKELIEENKRLRETLGFTERFIEYKKVAASVIAKEPGNWFNVFVVDRGTKDGVVNKSVVVTSSGLVGYVIDAGYNSSKVASIIDENCVVSSRLTKTRDIVIVKGSFELRNTGLCKMEYIQTETDVEAGDMVETSGLGGIFPGGILVGKIKEIRQGGHDISRYAIVEPSVDFKRLEEVFILVNK